MLIKLEQRGVTWSAELGKCTCNHKPNNSERINRTTGTCNAKLLSSQRGLKCTFHSDLLLSF
jgi:hypothetical protein